MPNTSPHSPSAPSAPSDAATRRQRTALALDVGTVRIGVALARAGDDVALDLAVILRKGTRTDVRTVAELARRHHVDLCVVGMPPGRDEGGRSARIAADFGAAVAGITGLLTVLVDEADTTAEADRELRALGQRAARRKRTIDQHAARILLGRWLSGAAAEVVVPAGPQPP